LLTTLFHHLKYIILSRDSNEKLVDQATKNSLCLIDNLVKTHSKIFSETDLSHYAIDFITQLYSESKSLISNDEVSEIVFGRIFNIIDAMCFRYDNNVLVLFFEPIMSMVFRISTNILVSREIKNKAEAVMIFFLIYLLGPRVFQWEIR